jgi:hypothetical protein
MIGVVFLMLLGLVSNSSDASIVKIEDQMFLINCPLPIYDGVATLVSIDGFALNYTVVYGSGAVDGGGSAQNFNGTFFECQLDLLSTPHFNANTIIKEYGATTLFGTVPYGWLGYVADFFTSVFQSLQAVFTLISFFVTPSGFNIAGFTIDDLSGQALLIVIMIYGFCYVTIGIMLYKVLSPFGGGD